MSGQIAAGPVEGSKAVLERIQVSVMMGNAKGNSTQDKADDIEESEHHEVPISNVQRVYTSLLAGAIAGALAKTVIAPLDRTKINFQISKMTYSQKAAIDFLVQSYKKEGLMSLWRGNSATMVRVVPYSAIQFAAHEQWKRILRVNGPDTKPINRLVAGSLAGVTSQSLTYPLDMARARMAVTQKAEYSTLRQVFVQIYRNEGVLAFYRGFFATILGVIPYAGCSFFTYDSLKNYFKDQEIHPGLSTATTLFCGATAGAVGQTASYPLDIIRRRMQTSAVKGAYYHTSFSTALKIYREEGIMAFYKGLSMNWVKGPVAVGISFATHDTIRDNLRLYLTG